MASIPPSVRDAVVAAYYPRALASPDSARTLQLMDELDIRYIYVGQIERITHGASVADKFEQLRMRGALELVFENEQTKIYSRVR